MSDGSFSFGDFPRQVRSVSCTIFVAYVDYWVSVQTQCSLVAKTRLDCFSVGFAQKTFKSVVRFNDVNQVGGVKTFQNNFYGIWK